MTNKEITKRLRELLYIEELDHIAVNRMRTGIEKLIDTLDPPKPEPGTVVWFPIDEECGVVADSGDGVYTSCGELVPWKDLQEGTKPARILASDEVAVKVPPVSDWPERAEDIRATFTKLRWDAAPTRDTWFDGHTLLTITRAEAEEMER